MNSNLIDYIREILHAVAGVLVWPVLLGLILLVAAMLVTLGAFAREAWERRRRPGYQLALAQKQLDEIHAAQAGESLDLHLERLLQDQERRLWRPLTRLRLAVRVGPALGLMGTLIPMAHALQGLAEGNLPSLATNMVTAFAATVIGLAASVTAYLVAAAREGWVRADTQALAFHAEHLLRTERGQPS
ncbi:MAG: MotA/TolQ/ExbB proton channel family protein [Propionibacteriaceae bacterium]|jgi:biopolymer transport protein ExbB/TolQ|nr:MotA/TolQ/ExbB proton channel family protein [Propionibacteriaceae bacterium]